MKVILIGSSGAMGQVLAKVAVEAGHEVVAGLQNEGDSLPNFPTTSNFADLSNLIQTEQIKADVIIDFSSPKLTEDLLTFATEYHLPIMLATTGHTKAQEEQIAAASQQIAILNTHNTSIGINIMQRIIQEATKALYPLGYDIEIVEKHHRYKKDSPSGTALMLLNSVEEGMTEKVDLAYGREGKDEQRTHNEVGIHAIRGGDIVGDHTVLYANNQEVLEITHRAGSKELFAKGALTGAAFLSNKAEAGLYNMTDVL